MRKILLTLLLFGLATSILLAQSKTVTGKITSGDDGSPLPGVNVAVKGTAQGAITAVDGTYSINVTDESVLIFSFIGYTKQEVTVGNRTVIDVVLQPDIKTLAEVVTIGYGTTTKKDVTGSISTINSKNIAGLPLLGVEQTLQGRASGIQVTQNSGTPGGGIQVRFRGTGSINASSEPLYVVDGIPINTGNYSGLGAGNQGLNALSDLNPADIESIDLLKDAAAGAIYGSRAANGVVLITTKRGKTGKTQINFNAYSGIQETWNRLSPLTGAQEVELLSEMVTNRYATYGADGKISSLATPSLGTGATPWATSADLAAYFYNSTTNVTTTNGALVAVEPATIDNIRDVNQFKNPSSASSTNWQDEIFRAAPISNYDLSASGGNEKTQFRVSGTYFNQEGIIIGSSFKRFSGRVNIDHKINDKIKFGTNLSLSRSVGTRINNDNNIYGVLSAAILMASDIPVRNSNGTYGRDPGSSVDNPIAAGTEPFWENISNRLIGGANIQYQILKDLSFRTSLSADFLYLKENRFLPTTSAAGLGSKGSGAAIATQDLGWISENTLNYQHTFASNHNVTGLLGVSYQVSKYEDVGAFATNFPGNDIKRLTAGAVKSDAYSTATSWGLASYFSRLHYDYNKKYLLDINFRIDGSSRFGKTNRYGYFPGVAAGWIVSDESFFQNVPLVSNLKLRASYGITGNQEIGNFNYLGLYSSSANGQNVRYIQSAAYAPSQLSNDELKWETASTLDVGGDLGLFNNRVNITASYFLKKNKDLLFNVPIPATSGFNTVFRNAGTMENEGFELTLNTVNLGNSSAIKWTTDFNFTFFKNRVTALPSGVPAFGSGFASWVQANEPLGTFRGYRVDKIFQSQEEINTLNSTAVANFGAGAVYQSSLTRPGDIKFKDLNNDGRITSDDQELIGSAQPTYYGGITNTLNGFGFDLSVFFQYTYGNKIYNNTASFAQGMNGVFGQTSEVLNRWTPTNTNTDIPRAVYGDPNNNRRVSDRFIQDGSFIRLKNITLGYTLPKAILSKIRLQNVRVYAQAQNALTFTKYKGLEPEVSTFSGVTSNTAPGTDFLTFPQARSYTFGINIGL